MPFDVVTTEEAEAQLAELQAKAQKAQVNRLEKGKKKASPQEGLYKQVVGTIAKLAADPRHPGGRSRHRPCAPPMGARADVLALGL